MKTIRVIALSLALVLIAANAQAYLISTTSFTTGIYPGTVSYIFTDTTPSASIPGTLTLTVLNFSGYALLSGVTGAEYTLPSSFSWKILDPGPHTFDVAFNASGSYVFYLTSFGTPSSGMLQLDKIDTASTPAPLAALLLASGLGGLTLFKRRTSA